MGRQNLPYRINCEAYLLYKGKVVARDTKRGYLEFPGGGVHRQETPIEALGREIIEETGAQVDNLKEIGLIRFDWSIRWAKTAKQKKRYSLFRGEEMHLFTGTVRKFFRSGSKRCASKWPGSKVMPLSKAVTFLQGMKPFPKEMQEYYSTQLEQLQLLARSAGKF